LTIQAAAELCGLSVRTLRRAINQGALRASELAAGRWVIRGEDLEAWIDSRANRPRDVSPVLVTDSTSRARPRPAGAGGLRSVVTDDMGRAA
jgi:excisionase family DNA binding protein